MTHIIRTSDRLTFKTCRQKWDLGSKIRQDYEPIQNIKPLEFGTAFHSAMEVYYDPHTWEWDREVVENLARTQFVKLCNEQRTTYLRVRSREDMDYDVELDYKERIELGLGMLDYYFKWAKQHDNFKPVFVEIEFEVPILVPSSLVGSQLLSNGFESCDGALWYRGEPVVYQGRVDAIVQDENGYYWIIDHKTAAQASSLQWLPLDDQIGSYVWALRHKLGLDIKGFLYTEVFKRVPHPPKELVRGGLSVNKQQDTTYELFMQTIIDGGYKVEAYADFLDWLKDNEKEYVRRSQEWRNPKALEILERRIFLEAVDMLNNPSIYPNPSKMACNGCWFFDPCLAIQEGGDVEFFLGSLYKKRSEATVSE